MILGYLLLQSEIPSDSLQTIWSEDRDLYGSYPLTTHSFLHFYILSRPHQASTENTFFLFLKKILKRTLVSVAARNELVKKTINFLTLHYIC